MGVLPVNMPQQGGSLLRFVMMSSQIPTLARGGVGVSIDKCIRASKSNGGWTTSHLTLKVTFKVTLSILVKENVWVVYVH